MSRDLELAEALLGAASGFASTTLTDGEIAHHLLKLFVLSPDFIVLMDWDNRPLFCNQRMR